MATSTRASVAEPEVRHPVATDRSRGWLLGWLCAEAALLFLVSWVGADLLGLHHDLYLLVYFTVALTFLAAFLARSGVDWRAYLRRNLAWSVGLGAVVAVLGVRNVWGDESTPRPSGSYLGFEVAWRGVAYGVVDALMLYGLPALVAYLVLRGQLGGAWRRVGVAALTLLLVLATTVVYHLGYAQFRDRDLREPATGAVIMSVPTLLTANPAGAVVAHTSVHVGALVHEAEGGNYLPPAPKGYPERLDGPAGLAVAGGWLALTAVLWWRGRRWVLGPASPPR